MAICCDKIISQYPTLDWDEDVKYCPHQGIAYQTDMSHGIKYGKEYFDRYLSYDDTEIARAINVARILLTEKYCGSLLDVGIGSGKFIRCSNIDVYGFDINEYATAWLEANNIFCSLTKESVKRFDGVTCWDSLEHMTAPSDFLDLFSPGMFLFLSIPLIGRLSSECTLEHLKASKHYKPNEHFYYFTRTGLIWFLTDCGFELIEENDNEIKVGREEVYTFVFRKNRFKENCHEDY